MKSTALQPTAENIKSSLLKDSIGRNEDLRYFLKLLDSLEGSYSLALDSEWGSGKTFFVRQAKLVLDCLNDNSHINADEETKQQVVKTIFQTGYDEIDDIYEIKQTFSTVYYNAWINDGQQDPIITLLYTFASQLGTKDSEGKSRNYVEIILKIFDAVNGTSLESIKKALEGKDLFEGLVREQAIQEKFSQLLKELIEERGDRLVVFIDEMDRCSPAFAVKLLERVKHFFLDDRVIFVFSVNMSQLKHTINHFYGAGFSGDIYLNRFFDTVVRLPEPNYPRFFESIGFEQLQSNALSEVCHLVINTFRLELREITLFADAMKNYDYLMKENVQLSLSGRTASAYLCIEYLLPILVGLSLKSSNEFDKFVSGKNVQPLLDVYNNSTQGQWLAMLLLNPHEVLKKEDVKDGLQLVKVEDKIRELYNAVFAHPDSLNIPIIKLGEFDFFADSITQLKRDFGKLSPFAAYKA
ncbi:MAG: KAP family P-loop NTPase fold protein [Christensenellales bacterium]|jgi:hypothetical protein